MSEFKPGLEGVVAFETEIAEPDRDGGALRYRGVDIEDLVGRVPFEEVWGLLVDNAPKPGLQPAQRYVATDLTGDAPADLQAVTAHLSGEWGLGKLIDISDEEARDDLARLSATMISVVAQSARLADGETTPVDPELVASGATAATRFLLEWRGEADPKHVQAIDTYWICTAEHGLNASTFTARVVASTGADCAASLSSAVGALSGPLHGGAPARVLPMLDGAAAADSIEDYVKDLLDSGGRLMGFGHRVYRAEDPRSRLLRGTAMDLGSPRFEVAEELERAALAELHRRKPDRVLATNVEFWSAVVLDVADGPAEPRARHVRVLAHGRLVGAHSRAEAARPARAPVRHLRRPRPALAREQLMDLGQAAALADEYAKGGLERELATLRAEWADEIEASCRSNDYRVRALAYRAIAQFRFRQKLELLRRGLEDDSPAVRGSALIALEGLSRAHPGRRQRVPAAAARARLARSQRRGAPARDRLLQERHAGARDDPDPRRHRGRRRDRRRGEEDRPLGVAAARQEVEPEVERVAETPLVGLIMGSRSDWETMQHAAETLTALEVPFEQRVVSAHRTPDLLFEYAGAAEERGLQVLIAGAGGAAHLPGMAAAKTALPVLGVPVESKTLKGMDSLLSIVQMPAGIPVGTLAIGRAGAVNAALLAAAILARSDEGIRARLAAFRAAQTQSVLDAPDPAA